MTARLTLRDENATGTVLGERTLDVLTDDITVRELITRRIQEEVREHNRRVPGAAFKGLVQPEARGAFPGTRPRALDWEAQRDVALRAFDANGFFVLVGDRQVESLDERIRVGVGTEVSFVKLVPLVGG